MNPITDDTIRQMAKRRTIYSLPGPSVRHPQRASRLRIILFIALAAAALCAFAYVLPGEAAPIGPGRTSPAPRCAVELATMRRSCNPDRFIGRFAPRSCETSRTSYRLCLAGK